MCRLQNVYKLKQLQLKESAKARGPALKQVEEESVGDQMTCPTNHRDKALRHQVLVAVTVHLSI